MEYLTPRVNRNCLICGSDFKSGISPGQRFILNDEVIYECDCKVQVRESPDNRFTLTIYGCKNNRLKDAKKCEIRLEKVNSIKLFNESYKLIHSEKHISQLKYKKYFVIDSFYIEDSIHVVEKVDSRFLIVFTDLEKAKKYFKLSMKALNLKPCLPKKISKEKITKKYSRFYCHAIINPGLKLDFIKNTKIVKICDT